MNFLSKKGPMNVSLIITAKIQLYTAETIRSDDTSEVSYVVK